MCGTNGLFLRFPRHRTASLRDAFLWHTVDWKAGFFVQGSGWSGLGAAEDVRPPRNCNQLALKAFFPHFSTSADLRVKSFYIKVVVDLGGKHSYVQCAWDRLPGGTNSSPSCGWLDCLGSRWAVLASSTMVWHSFGSFGSAVSRHLDGSPKPPDRSCPGALQAAPPRFRAEYRGAWCRRSGAAAQPLWRHAPMATG